MDYSKIEVEDKEAASKPPEALKSADHSQPQSRSQSLEFQADKVNKIEEASVQDEDDLRKSKSSAFKKSLSSSQRSNIT